MLKILKLYNCKDKKCHLNIFQPELCNTPWRKLSKTIYATKESIPCFPAEFLYDLYELQIKVENGLHVQTRGILLSRIPDRFYLCKSQCRFLCAYSLRRPFAQNIKVLHFSASCISISIRSFLLLALPTLAENIH
jgi:hypothetical protein